MFLNAPPIIQAFLAVSLCDTDLGLMGYVVEYEVSPPTVCMPSQQKVNIELIQVVQLLQSTTKHKARHRTTMEPNLCLFVLVSVNTTY